MDRFPGLNAKRHGGSYVPRASNNSTTTTSSQSQNTNTTIVAAHEHTQTAAGGGQDGNQGSQSSLQSTAQTMNVYFRPKSHGGGYIPKRSA